MARNAFASFRTRIPLARHVAAAASGVIFVLIATAVRVWLNQIAPGLALFSFYYPAILAAAILGGEVGAVSALGFGAGICWVLLHSESAPAVSPSALILNLMIFVFSGAFVGIVGSRLRWLLRRRRRDIQRLAEREARYRALFEGVSEGFALVEGIWDESGRLTDFIVTEANPAMLKMLNTSMPIIGLRRRDYPVPAHPEYLEGCEKAFRDGSVRFELYTHHFDRWFDVRLSRVGDNKLAQIFVDVTDRKLAETRQAEMFDELNHRVKNNLASVAAMLNMQARVADDARVREQLRKAIDRIETIGDVHASLYRASSTDEVDFSAYLKRLCERLSSSLVEGDRVWMEVEMDPTMAPLEEAVALGLIVNELVTNAVKYAYPAPASGPIRVTLHNDPGELTLKVSDEGCGLPASGKTTGIGMRLVRSLVQQCRGELEVSGNGGASFTVHLREHARPRAQEAQNQLL